MDIETRKKIDELVALLRHTAFDPCAIALAGAHAKGVADASSDIFQFILQICTAP